VNSTSKRAREIFEEALEIPSGAELTQYLDAACGSDTKLRERIEALLRAHEAAQCFLPDAPPEAMEEALRSEKPGDLIGRYKLLEKIGEGGCGVVYLAEQQEPVRRQVAFKLIKLGMDTKAVVARFQAERQALALMDHPNIARVFDAGATENGRPFFVMQLVNGLRLTEHCDKHRLSIPERLRLFLLVCEAIEHAHQKGVIHRDIKPSNILVTVHASVAVPKVIDFGIAKAIQAPLTEQTLFTQAHELIGTPAYMSPEQAEMSALDVDTRTDIYSLGVLLYELLTGETPFDARALLQSGLDQLRRVIREVEPVRPSRRLKRQSVPSGPAKSQIANRKSQIANQPRPGLDRDEVPREGPCTTLRYRQRPGPGHPQLSQRRANSREAA
jgi:serine/threonine protein kinase